MGTGITFGRWKVESVMRERMGGEECGERVAGKLERILKRGR